MKFNLKKMFAEFGAILSDLWLFEDGGQKLPTRLKTENLNYCYALLFDLKLMRLRVKIFMNMLGACPL